jgi:hypothetical protein
MPVRVIALFLILVLVWSGLSSKEAPRAVAQHAQLHAAPHAEGLAAPHEGSVEDHHLDDLPVQAQGDQPHETPGLLPASLSAVDQSLAMMRPSRFDAAAVAPPFLAGPLRPPSSPPLMG